MIPALQTEKLVRFLRDCLRADSTLASVLGVSPDLICRGALEVEPVGYAGDNLAVYVTEFPCVCAREQSATTVYAGPHQGQDASIKLWYIMRPLAGDMSGDFPVPAKALTDRWLRVIYWRMLYWIRTHALGETDLLTDGQIYRIGLPTAVRYRHVADVSLFEADLKMQYFLPPYLATPPALLQGIDYTLGDTDAPPDDGAFVESEVDLQP